MKLVVVAGFGVGWIIKDCVVMRLLSWMNRVNPEAVESNLKNLKNVQNLKENQRRQPVVYWSDEAQDLIVRGP